MNKNIDNLIDTVLNEQSIEINVQEESGDLIDWETPIDSMTMDMYFEGVYLKPIKEFMAVSANNSNSVVSVPDAPKVKKNGIYKLDKSNAFKIGVNKAKKISEAIKVNDTNIRKIKLEVCSECFGLDDEKEQHKCIETIETILENSVKSLKEGTSTRLDLSNAILNEIKSIEKMDKEVKKEKQEIKQQEQDLDKLKEPLEKMEKFKNKLKEGIGGALLKGGIGGALLKGGIGTAKIVAKNPIKTAVGGYAGYEVAKPTIIKHKMNSIRDEAKEDADKYLIARKYGQPVDPQSFLQRQYNRELQNYDNKKALKDSVIRKMYKKFKGEDPK